MVMEPIFFNHFLFVTNTAFMKFEHYLVTRLKGYSSPLTHTFTISGALHSFLHLNFHLVSSPF